MSCAAILRQVAQPKILFQLYYPFVKVSDYLLPQTKRASYRQRRMGPAPFASLEDLSDDQDSPPPGNNGSRLTVLPGIKEDSLQMPATPRIDISRASSSSHQDSNNSSPERELFAGENRRYQISLLNLLVLYRGSTTRKNIPI